MQAIVTEGLIKDYGALRALHGLGLRVSAVGVIVGALLASVALNFLAAFWEPAKRVAFLGVLNYYQPLPVIISGAWPTQDMVVLLAVAVVTWGIGLGVISRREIRAA